MFRRWPSAQLQQSLELALLLRNSHLLRFH
jgi:hypothetical protein